MRHFLANVCLVCAAAVGCGGANEFSLGPDDGAVDGGDNRDGASPPSTGADSAPDGMAGAASDSGGDSPSTDATVTGTTDSGADVAAGPDSAPPPSDAASATDSMRDAPTGALADSPVGDAPPADTGTTSDAGGDAAGPVPGELACGMSTCDERTQLCCVQVDAAQACLANGTPCIGGARRECDKASDCAAGNVCCYDFSTVPASSSCHADCGGGGGTRVQACRTASECLGGTCAVHACTAGGSIQACNGFAPECP